MDSTPGSGGPSGDDRVDDRVKVIGVGLNKTGTKTLQHCLEQWGYRHRSYDKSAFDRYRAGRIPELLTEMEGFDSCEDWPWPLMYEEIDRRFPDAKFVLTTRRDAQTWFRSLCKMAVRMGPLHDFEEHVYGWAMPQGHEAEHVEFYERHNDAVRRHFAARPGKLLELCWDLDASTDALAQFLGQPPLTGPAPQINASARVYTGDNLWFAHVNRIGFQTAWRAKMLARSVIRRVRPRR